MNRWNSAAVAAILGLALVTPAIAQWKWRDKTGHTQYSDIPPPPGVPESDILQRPAAARRAGPVVTAPAPAELSASAAPAPAARASDPELEAKRKKTEQDAADKKKAEEAKVSAARAENCVRVREQIRALDTGQRMSRINEKGERIVLDDAARASEMQRAREAMASECR